MVSGIHKSRTMRRISVKTPGNAVVKQYALRKPAKATCAVTEAPLQGVPRARPSKLKKIPRSSRSPQRPYGGVLTSDAARKKIIADARKLN